MAIRILFRNGSPGLNFAIQKLSQSLTELGETLEIRNFVDESEAPDVGIAMSREEALSLYGLTIDPSIGSEGFEIRRATFHDQSMLVVLAPDESGAMYGTLELAEQLQIHGKLSEIPECTKTPKFSFRALKFNLPWSSYRNNKSFELQKETVRDLAFWEKFLDMMVENRYNVLTLWSVHPFPYMIRTAHFPKATPFSDSELLDWKEYWTKLFRMAKDRGIETYLVTWNIFVSE